jgi:hypothetical protein
MHWKVELRPNGYWYIYDLEYPKRGHIATLTPELHCDYHNRHYWGTNVSDWVKAVQQVSKKAED